MNSQTTQIPPNPRPLSSARSIVVVDDDAVLVDTLEQILLDEGYLVESFTDPIAALTRLRAQPRPDLILLDCVMPRLTGPELHSALAADGIDTPVVLMTALSDPSFCAPPGNASVLTKPFQIEDLLAELSTTMRRAKPPPVIAS